MNNPEGFAELTEKLGELREQLVALGNEAGVAREHVRRLRGSLLYMAHEIETQEELPFLSSKAVAKGLRGLVEDSIKELPDLAEKP